MYPGTRVVDLPHGDLGMSPGEGEAVADVTMQASEKYHEHKREG